MSDHDSTATHPADAHDGGHDTGHDEHHDGGTLGAIDWRMWGAGALGVLAAIPVLVAWVVATQFAFLGGG